MAATSPTMRPSSGQRNQDISGPTAATKQHGLGSFAASFPQNPPWRLSPQAGIATHSSPVVKGTTRGRPGLFGVNHGGGAGVGGWAASMTAAPTTIARILKRHPPPELTAPTEYHLTKRLRLERPFFCFGRGYLTRPYDAAPRWICRRPLPPLRTAAFLCAFEGLSSGGASATASICLSVWPAPVLTSPLIARAKAMLPPIGRP